MAVGPCRSVLIAAAAGAADAPLVRKAPPLAPAVRLERLLRRRPRRLWPRQHAKHAVRSARRRMASAPSAASMAASRPDTTSCSRRDFCSASRATFRSRSSSRTARCRGGRRRSAPTSSIRSITSRRCAPASATSFGNTMVYGTGGLATAQTRFLEDAGRRPSAGQDPSPALRLDGRRRRRVRARAGLDRADRISLRPLRRRVGRVALRHRRGLRVSTCTPCGSASTTFCNPGDPAASRAGRRWHGEPVADRAGGLERARPVHADRAGLSGVPLAVSGPEQPGGLARSSRTPRARPPSSASALWDGMEFYVNPELMQGFGLSDTFGARGLSERRGAEVGLPVSAAEHRPRLRAQDLRARRRAGDDRGRAEPACRQAGHLAHHRHRRKDVGDRLFRQQQLLARSAHQFHELEHVLLRLLRPDDGQGRLHLGRARGAEPEVLGVPRRLFPGAGRLQRQPVRHQHPGSRRIHRRAGAALLDRRAARQAAPDRLGQPRQRRQLCRGRRAADDVAELSRHRADAARSATTTASSSMSSRRSPTTSGCSRARAGTPARPRRSAGPTPTKACRSAARSRAPHGDGPTTRSASAAWSKGCRARRAPISRPAGSAS